MIRQFTVISIFCSNKWQARNQVFLTGRYDPSTRGTKRGRRRKSLGEGAGGGELRCLRLHFKRFEGSVERKHAAKRRNVDISQNVWTLKLICLPKKQLYVCILKMRMTMAMLLHVFEKNLLYKESCKSDYSLARGSTIGLAGCGIWLFFVVILGMRAENRSGMREF